MTFYPADLSFTAREQLQSFNQTQLFTAGAWLKSQHYLTLFTFLSLAEYSTMNSAIITVFNTASVQNQNAFSVSKDSAGLQSTQHQTEHVNSYN